MAGKSGRGLECLGSVWREAGWHGEKRQAALVAIGLVMSWPVEVRLAGSVRLVRIRTGGAR